MRIEKYDNLNIIADKLIEEILKNKNPFDTYNIVLPNLILEQWFKAYWLKKTNKVLLNVKFTRLLPFINEAYNNSIPIMSTDKMSLFITDILLKNKNSFKEIIDYYDNNYVNLYDLSNNLSRLFNKYENDCFTPSSYQKIIYDKLYENNNYIFLRKIINNPIAVDKKTFIIGFTSIDNIYYKALEKLQNTTIYLQNNIKLEHDFYLCSAASKEREIEFIHDEICKLLENNVKLYDILVYAPKVNDYEGFIKKVFSTGGDKSFPFVPYVIMNNNRDLSNSAEAISLLYNILISDEFTRNDFYKLITNPSIQKSRGIDNNKVNDIIESLDKMNVYRNHKKCDEWLYGIKRLLLSKLIGNSYNDNYINLNGDIYLPYGNIAMDDNTISVICDIVNDILEFRKNNDFSVDNIKILLDKWLSYSKNQEFEENYYYNSSLRILDFIKENNLELPKEIIFKALINSSKNITITPANIITGGVTFLDFNPKNVISSKYIFLLGMSDNNLPRIDCNDELDERLVRKSITTIDYETYNFICNNATKLYMSYVNIDLKSLQKFMPSLLLSKNTPDLILGLSEDRDYSSLYSKSEFNKKSYGINLTKNFNSIEKSYSLLELPKIVKYRELADFINEGLQAKIKRLITKNDNSLEKSSKEYEPLKSSIDYKLKNDLILKMLEERTNELDEEIIDEIFDRYKITHDIPYLENDIDDSIKVCKNYFMTIIEGYNLCKPFTLDLNYNDFNWTLDIKDSFIFSFNDGKYYFYNLYPNTYKKPSDYTKIYIISLAYIVKENISNAIIRLNNNKEFEVSLNTAIYLLNELYNKYNDYSLCYFSPINSYSLNNDQYDDVIKNSKTEWRNFNDSNMVKIRDIAGYNRKSFKDFWDKYKKEVNNLVLYNIEEDNND